MKICSALQFKKNEAGKLILQAKWLPVQFSGTFALQLAGDESDWEDVDLANNILPLDPEEVENIKSTDPVESVSSENKSKEEKDAVMKVKASEVKEKK